MVESSSSRASVDCEPTDLRLGRYRIHGSIASGGMAAVHLASVDGHEGFSKLVALKVIHEHLADDPTFVAMFLDEARIAARIEHANVCTVFDFGECDGSYYIAMEYLAGETFSTVRDAVRKRAYDSTWPAMASSLIVQACEGLHAAHNLLDAAGAPMGLVHRDISPQNLFVTYTGTVKVVDFGIARASGRTQQTVPGTLKGKFAYLAPEQLTDADNVDRRVDVWALGVTLWELLALRPLFRRATPAETLTCVMGQTIPTPSSIQASVPPALDAIVMRALCRDPAGRYGSARELGRDLAAFCRTHGGLSGSCEIEEWLEALLPGGREERRTHSMVTPVESYTRVREPSSARAPAPRLVETAQAITLRPSARRPIESATTDRDADRESRRPPALDLRRDRLRGLIATGTLLLVGIAVGILAAASQPESVPARAGPTTPTTAKIEP